MLRGKTWVVFLDAILRGRHYACLQSFQFLRKFLSMWSHDADMQIDTAHRSGIEKVLVVTGYNHFITMFIKLGLLEITGVLRLVSVIPGFCVDDHRCIQICCTDVLF